MASKRSSFYLIASALNSTFNAEDTWPRGRAGRLPVGIGRPWQEIWPGVSRLSLRLPDRVLGGFVCYRYVFASVSIVLRLRWFRHYFLFLAYGVGAYRVRGGAALFLVSRLVLGLVMCGGFALAFRYSCAEYRDYLLKLTMRYRSQRKGRQKCEFCVFCIPCLNSVRVYQAGNSHGPPGALVTRMGLTDQI